MKVALVVITFISCVVAFFSLYVGVTHNSMGEFCRNLDLDECKFDYYYAAFIWLTWFIPFFVVQLVTFCFVRFVISVITKQSR